MDHLVFYESHVVAAAVTVVVATLWLAAADVTREAMAGAAAPDLARFAESLSWWFATTSYALMALFVAWLVAPDPAALSKPRVDMQAAKKAKFSDVDFKAVMAREAPKTGDKYLIIGAGFLGKKLIYALLARGETDIVAFDMDPHACDMFANDARVSFVRGDVTNYEQLLAVTRGRDVVYATFAIIRFMDRMAHQAALSYRVNVLGTENVVRACREANVKLLIQTSTSNVNLSAANATLDMDENVKYISRDESPHHYGWTKAIAEQTVLRADNVQGHALRTVAVRPCSAIFGADDRHLLEPMLKMGRTLLPHNGGAGVVDFVPVMNVVYGHLLAERKLRDAPEVVGGQAYCVTGRAMRMRDFVGLIDAMRPGGLVVVPTPRNLVIAVSHVIDALTYFNVHVPGQVGLLTTAMVKYIDINYSFNCKKARAHLGYSPLYSVEQGMHHAIAEWQRGEYLL